MTRFDEIFCSFTLYLYLVRESSHKRDGIEKKSDVWLKDSSHPPAIHQSEWCQKWTADGLFDSHALNSHFQGGKLISQ